MVYKWAQGVVPHGVAAVAAVRRATAQGRAQDVCQSVVRDAQTLLPTEQHPGYSPDLNPIENAFAGAERELSKLLANRPAKNVGETLKYFKKALKTVADSGEILKAAQSMPRRLKAVLDANGQATKY